MFRSLAGEVGPTSVDLAGHLPDSEVGTVRVGEQSFLVGRTLKDIGLRAEYGITLLAVQREGKTYANPGADFVFRAADLLIVFGEPRQVADAAALARGVDSWPR
jgi:uncharacterized protein with PhoU and TrkA domain